ncbi:MAG: aminodeoxychorismate lyase [Gammaproteobacteria bacterium]|nr:MAG: aminodeoxychorismate lyase [Gammaproteobacteria bacterium]
MTPPDGSLVDGIPADRVGVRDRGLHYGDGLFETLAVRAGEPLNWEAHLERLEEGGRRLSLPVPPADLLLDEVRRVSGGVDRCVVKLILTRGEGGRGYRPPDEARARRIVIASPWPDYPPERFDRGIQVRLCRVRLGRNPALAGLKHLGRLEQVLARAEWSDPEIHEGLMLDEPGHPVEGTMSNLFLVRGDGMLTADLSAAGVAGVMRRRVLEAAAGLGIEVVVRELTMEDICRASEAFFCNSLIGLWPVRRWLLEPVLEHDDWPLTRRLRNRLLEQGWLP